MALTREQINAVYQQALGRSADEAGANYWASPEADSANLYNKLLYSPEGRKRMIEDVYARTLGRGADAGGLEYWMNSGKDAGAIEQGLYSSAEGAPLAKQKGINATLLQDPAYAAYIRQMGYDQAASENQRLTDTDRLRAGEGVQYANLDRQQGQSMQKIDNAYGGRGMYRAGGRLRDQGESLAEYGAQRNTYAVSQAQRLADMQAKSSQEMSEVSRRRDEQEVAARNRLYERDAKAAY